MEGGDREPESVVGLHGVKLRAAALGWTPVGTGWFGLTNPRPRVRGQIMSGCDENER